MRFFVASLVTSLAIAAACGSAPKKEGAIVNEGSNAAPTCCCKTIPVTDEKEITPQYGMQPRMECSTSKGECVDDVQCNAAQPETQTPSNGVPPPAVLQPSDPQ